MDKLSEKEMALAKGGDKTPPKGYWLWNGLEWVWVEINDIDPIPEIM